MGLGGGGGVGSAKVVVHPDTSRFQRELGGDVNRMISGTEHGIRNKLGRALKTTALIGAAAFAAVAMAGTAAVGGILGKGIAMNAELETSTKMFETLMGDAQRAEDHVKSLFDFAAKTPFETGPIIEASKHLQTFGGDALNTEKTLNLVGDAAAATGQNINEVGFWTGRAYSMIQGGKPFGEAAMRLQEMGIMTPKAREEMEALQKSGADSTVVWAAFEQGMTKFTGAMIEQAGTWKGLTSTLSDVVSMGAAKLTAPMFESVKKLAGAFIELTNTDIWAGWLDKGVELLEPVVGWVDKLADRISSFASGDSALGKPFEGLSGLGSMFSPILDVFQALGPVMAPVFTLLQQALPPILSALGPALGALGGAFGAIVAAVIPLVTVIAQALAPIILALAPIIAALAPILARVAVALGGALGGAINAIAPLVVGIGRVIGEVLRIMGPLLPMIITLAGGLLAALLPAVSSILRAFLPLLPVLAQLIMVLLPPLIQILNALVPVINLAAGIVAKLADVLGAVLGGAVRLILPVLKGLGSVIEFLIRPIEIVMRWINRLAKALGGLKIPDFLKRASPSPIEQTLAGMRTGLRDVNGLLAGTDSRLRRLHRPDLGIAMDSGTAARQAANAASSGGGSSNLVVEVPVIVDGRELARVVTPLIRDETIRLGQTSVDIYGGLA